MKHTHFLILRGKRILRIENVELQRRIQEVQVVQNELDVVKKINEENEDNIQGKIKVLQMKLDDLRIDNRFVILNNK